MNIVDADHTFLAGCTVLYVEDDPEVRSATGAFLGRRVKRVVSAGDGEEGLASFRKEQPDMLVTDIQMPNMGGLSLAAAVHAEAPDLPVIVTTAFERTDYLLRAIELGVDRYVLKPVNVDRLEDALLYCAHILRLKHEAHALQQAKADLLQARHEETLGLLASGMAHDYSNLLQVVMSSVTLAKAYIGKPDQALEFMTHAESACKEAKELGTNLRLLTQTREGERQVGSLLPILRKVLDRKFQGPAYHVACAFPEDLPTTRFNGRQMERVFEVLARNADEAMGGKGVVRVEAALATVDVSDELPLEAGTYLHLTVSDSGPGLDPKLYPIMFSPYASTKDRGAQRGTGTGLAIARAIMKLHGGAVTADPPTPEGATLHLYLPVADAGTQRP